MKIAITGGTGFIGRRLITTHLARGDQVRYLTRDKNSLIDGAVACCGDLDDTGQLTAFANGADVLYHCAAELRDETKMTTTNVRGTAHLLAAACGRVGRWVQLSSTGVYGPQRFGLVTEDSVLAPVNEYEKTKTQSDLLVQEAVETSGLDAVIIRPSIVYGEDMPNQSLFQLIRMINKGLFFYLGKPGAAANYIYVDNVIDAMLLAGQAKPMESGRAYIVSDHCTMEEFIALIAINLGKSAPEIRIPESIARFIVKSLTPIMPLPLNTSRIDALTGTAVYSSERIERELSYRNRVSMADGLSRVVHHWRMMQ